MQEKEIPRIKIHLIKSSAPTSETTGSSLINLPSDSESPASISVTVCWRHIAHHGLVLFRDHLGINTALCDRPVAFAVVVPDRQHVCHGHGGREGQEGHADDVSRSIERRVFRQEGVGGNDAANWSLGLALGVEWGKEDILLPKPICQAVPTLRRRCPPRFIANQQTSTGMAL